MSLKAKLSASVAAPSTDAGFQLVVPSTVHWRDVDSFRDAVKAQAESTALIPADCLLEVDIDGTVGGTDLRLSRAAFGDLCQFSGIPVSFIKKLAIADEQQAIDVIATMLRSTFHRGAGKQLVVDSAAGRIDGIVGAESYAHIANQEALDYLLTAAPGLKLSNGWLAGPNMRVTAIVGDKPAQARKGDLIHFGVNLENSIHGDRSLRVSDYFERLVCTNGAVARDAEHTTVLVHRGDIEYNTQKAVVASAGRAAQAFPYVEHAVSHLMLPEEILAVRSFIREPKYGGSPSLEVKAVKEAQLGAAQENRPPEETTLWNWVNAVTAAAHDTDSLNRKAELEALGYRTLVRFGALAT